ncbi:MAG: terminase [Aquihabitans sp.]
MNNTKPSTPPTPPGLDARGRSFWESTVSTYGLSSVERELLLEACRTMDELDLLAVAVRRDGVIVEGSVGQNVVNNALTEARGLRTTLHRLLAALQLPDIEGATAPTAAQIGARTAAQARWSRQAGAS